MPASSSFGRYRVGRELGRGGMATVHEAWIDGPDGFSRRVALKRIRVDGAAPPDLERLFSDEARIASHLHHANLVGILDYGVVDGAPFQALELVEGTTLEALVDELSMRGERLPEAIALHIVREIAHGLAHAHRATDAAGKPLGLVHRDVSPSNVLVGWNGDVKLSDFGIAFARGREVETAHGVTRGKPSYMAPEQATRGTLDARTDLFGLGCTLHFALTGKSPLEGDQVLLRLLTGERAPLASELTGDVRAIVASAVSPEKRERPVSADALIAKLDEAYRARSMRDGRAELRAWLAPHAARRPAPAPAVASETGQPTVPARPAPPARSARSVVLAVLGVATLVVLALIGARFGLAEPAPPPSHDALARTDDAAIATDAGAAVTEEDAAPAPSPPPPSVRAPEPPPSSAAAPHPSSVPHASELPSESVRPAASERGWLRIVAGCDDARGGAVTIDGAPTGESVPTTARVPVGAHAVRVLAPDGRVYEGNVSVTAFHTEGSPAWFRACTAP